MSRRFIIRAKPYELPSVIGDTRVGVAWLAPVGVILELKADAAVPDGWLLCDGGSYEAGEYPELDKVIRENFQAGVLPDLREVPAIQAW